jgi:hypothetical protein
MHPEDEAQFSWDNPVDPEADISSIVTNISGRRAQTRRNLANGPETRAFLDAALTLTSDLFAAEPSPESDDEDDVRPTMSYLSRRKVLERAKEAQPNLMLTEAMLRHRWQSHPDFLADFISYALAERHWSLGVAFSAHTRELLLRSNDFSAAVHRVAYEDLRRVISLPTYRFQLLAVASAQADSASAKAVTDMYSHLSEAWTSLYGEVFDHYGIKLRPGITLETLNIILQATAEGLGMRLMAGVDEPILKAEDYTSLLGTAALSLFLAFVDIGDGLSIESLVNRTVQGNQGP